MALERLNAEQVTYLARQVDYEIAFSGSLPAYYRREEDIDYLGHLRRVFRSVARIISDDERLAQSISSAREALNFPEGSAQTQANIQLTACLIATRELGPVVLLPSHRVVEFEIKGEPNGVYIGGVYGQDRWN